MKITVKFSITQDHGFVTTPQPRPHLSVIPDVCHLFRHAWQSVSHHHTSSGWRFLAVASSSPASPWHSALNVFCPPAWIINKRKPPLRRCCTLRRAHADAGSPGCTPVTANHRRRFWLALVCHQALRASTRACTQPSVTGEGFGIQWCTGVRGLGCVWMHVYTQTHSDKYSETEVHHTSILSLPCRLSASSSDKPTHPYSRGVNTVVGTWDTHTHTIIDKIIRKLISVFLQKVCD